MQKRLLILTCCLLLCLRFYGADSTDVVRQSPDSVWVAERSSLTKEWATNERLHYDDAFSASADEAFRPKKRTWLAATEIVGSNLGLLAFDHFVLDAAYAEVTMKTIKRNIKLTEWFWDSDVFHTNLGEHPYHGSLYFNAARANGLNFWASALMTTGGSLMWELVGECELPSVNDFLATSFGGTCIGEVEYRLSDLVLDDSKRGGKRVISELLAALISPMRGLNRVITGEAFKRRGFSPLSSKRIFSSFSTGLRHVSLSCRGKYGLYTPYLDADIYYGDKTRTSGIPFESFDASLHLVIGNHQEAFNTIRASGQIMSRNIAESDRFVASIGLWQHFNYMFSNPIHGGETAYNISEAASAGPGFNYVWRGCDWSLDGSLMASGVLLGGLMTDDNDNQFGRTYNVGSGFSLKNRMMLQIGRRIMARLDIDYYRLFTWIGYDNINPEDEWFRHSTQGEAGCAWQLMTTPLIDVIVWKNCGLRASWTIYNRHTRYEQKTNVHSRASEVEVGLVWHIQ